MPMTACGLCEAVRFDRGDTDLHEGPLTIRNSKFGVSRQIPLHPTDVVALTGYAVNSVVCPSASHARHCDRPDQGGPASSSGGRRAVKTRRLPAGGCKQWPACI
jgi:hypothetical protein